MADTLWQPMTDEDVEWVNNPGKKSRVSMIVSPGYLPIRHLRRSLVASVTVSLESPILFN